MYEATREEFEEMIARAVEETPEQFRAQIANLEFAAEDWASPDDYARTSSPEGSMLLGVYRGIPLPRRGGGYNMALPDRIVVFQQPLQRMAGDAVDLYERVSHVIRHEIAHYFGISDERLREIDAY